MAELQTMWTTLCRRLNLREEQLEVSEIARGRLRIPSKVKRVWKIITGEGAELFVYAWPAKSDHFFYSMHLKRVCEMLGGMQLQYSRYPQSLDYFRAMENGEEYDIAVTCGEKADLLLDYAKKGEKDKLRHALDLLGKALGELHLTRAEYRPSMVCKRIEEFYHYGQKCFLHQFKSLQLRGKCADYLNKLEEFRIEANHHPYLTGVIHFDPALRNFMYDPHADTIIFLDVEGIVQGLNEKMQAVGPIAFDLVLVYNNLLEELGGNGLAPEVMQPFTSSYRDYCGDIFPHPAHVRFFQAVELMKKLCLLRANHLTDSKRAVRKRFQLEQLIFKSEVFWG